MRNNNSLVYSVALVVGDFVALTAAFATAYILRVSLSHVPISAHVQAMTYIGIVLGTLPFFILIFALLGLYGARVYDNRFSEFGRLLIGSIIGVMAVVTYSYMANVAIFPARLVVLYGFLLAFLYVLLFRTIARGLRRQLFKYDVGINRVLLVGDSKLTPTLLSAMASRRASGEVVVGVVGGVKHRLEPNTGFLLFPTFEDAIKAFKTSPPNTIIQTELFRDNEKNDFILEYAQQHHIDYRFVPGNSELFVGKLDVELIHSVPMVAVHQTPLIGWGRVVKRLTDVVLGGLLLLIALPFMLLIVIIQKLSSPRGDIMYTVNRLTRFGKQAKIYKFRTMKQAYTNMSPEEGFQKMGRPELIKEYRSNGDQLVDDPRVSSFGRFLRKTSLDELPQLINIVKGDISLVGPRALDPFELEKYAQKHLILSVKSGLTGLAVVSGRRDIPFNERRKLDIYYVQNWSFWGDIVILLRTFWIVLTGRGAR